MRSRFLLVMVLLLGCAALMNAADRSGPRLLYDFENVAEIDELRAKSDSVALDMVQDNGVTHGRTCCRMVFKQGGGDGVVQLGASRLKDWSGYGAIAFDVFQERTEKWTVNVELWDRASHNYATRCTYSSVIRPGKNTVVVAIDHSKRNSKEGRDWSELEPQDKIDLDGLKIVKIFLSCPTAGGDLVWWVDNIRLLTSDALSGPPMAITLPAGSKAFLLGRSTAEVAGFTPVPATATFGAATICGVKSGHPQVTGKGWPDVLTGTGLLDPTGAPVEIAVAVPDGQYHVWLAGGMAIDPEAEKPAFTLRVGDTVLYDDHPTPAQLASEKYLFRFLPPLYSERDNALWLDYIDHMYQTWDVPVTVHGGTLVVSATRFWLSSIILVPQKEAAAYAALTAQIRMARMQAFARTLTLDPQHKPQRASSDPAGIAFIPDTATVFHPDTAPSAAERARRSYDLAAAPGQRVVLRLGLTPYEALGDCHVALSALTGPTTIPAGAGRLYLMDYRVRGDDVQEAALKPLDHVMAEKGITWCFYAWLPIPDNAPPGAYTGSVTLTPGTGAAQVFPVSMTVYPLHLRSNPPFAFGMYYEIPADPTIHQQQLHFMREIGLTATAVPAGEVFGIDGERVKVRFNAGAYQRVKEAGFGREPHQLQMSSSLGVARRIASAYLGFGARVNQRPGCEMEDPRLKPLYEDYLRQYNTMIQGLGLPVGVEIVDEPREVPNPWNRSLAHTNTYADWMHEAGITTGFVTAMGDTGDGKDYTTLVEHAGILSTHAGAGSEKMMRKTIAAGKPLWVYNTGMDRLSWGFYMGRVGAVGRWEWHFCFSDPGSTHDYPNVAEWFNPFTACDGFSPHAPADYPGAMLFKSVYFDVAEGILDATYLVTLKDALQKAGGDPGKAGAVATANALLAELDKAIPFLPDVHGLVGESAGALVGQGLHTAVAERCGEWRQRAAQAIIALGQ